MEEAIADSDMCGFSEKIKKTPLNGCLPNEHVIAARCRHETNIKGGTACAITQLRKTHELWDKLPKLSSTPDAVDCRVLNRE